LVPFHPTAEKGELGDTPKPPPCRGISVVTTFQPHSASIQSQGMRGVVMLVLGRAELREIVTVDLALRAAREAFVALASGGALVPPRIHLDTPNGVSLIMPAFREAGDAVALKAVSVNPANPTRNLPTVQGLVLLFDEATGTPLV